MSRYMYILCIYKLLTDVGEINDKLLINVREINDKLMINVREINENF